MDPSTWQSILASPGVCANAAACKAAFSDFHQDCKLEGTAQYGHTQESALKKKREGDMT